MAHPWARRCYVWFRHTEGVPKWRAPFDLESWPKAVGNTYSSLANSRKKCAWWIFCVLWMLLGSCFLFPWEKKEKSSQQPSWKHGLCGLCERIRAADALHQIIWKILFFKMLQHRIFNMWLLFLIFLNQPCYLKPWNLSDWHTFQNPTAGKVSNPPVGLYVQIYLRIRL